MAEVGGAGRLSLHFYTAGINIAAKWLIKSKRRSAAGSLHGCAVQQSHAATKTNLSSAGVRAVRESVV